jgi:hypothetical protein
MKGRKDMKGRKGRKDWMDRKGRKGFRALGAGANL